MVHPSQAVSAITAFSDNYNASMRYLATLDHIAVNDAIEGMMRACYLTNHPEISSITQVNDRGTITFSYPNESITGTCISYQTHVREVLTTDTRLIEENALDPGKPCMV